MKLFQSKDGRALVYAASTKQASEVSGIEPGDLVKLNDAAVFALKAKAKQSAVTSEPEVPVPTPTAGE